MPIPSFDQIMRNPAEWALLIDIDGTLLDMAPEPDAVVVPPEVVRILAGLQKTFGAVALSTGREVSDADRLFAPLQLLTCGVHGTEARMEPHGETIMLVPPVPKSLVDAVSEAARVAPGAIVEEKGPGMAVHYRNVMEPQALQLAEELVRVVGRHETYVLRPGRRVFEIIPKGYSKGTALAWVMQLEPFRGRRPIMIGDDAGDEPALVAAEEHGGFGLKVAGEHFSAADADFTGISHVRSWLASLAGLSATGTVVQAGNQ